MNIKIPKWNITEMTGYEPQTTAFEDFSIADKFGLNAIKDTFNRIMKEWQSNYIFMTELALVINWKCWEHYHRSRKELQPFLPNHAEVGQWYKDTYDNPLDCADNHLEGKELQYFYKTLD